MSGFRSISILFLFAMTGNAGATVIETSAGYRYDVQTGEPLSPYSAWLSTQSLPPESSVKAVELQELRYQTKIPLSQADKVGSEAIEVFERYHKAMGTDLSQQFREAMKEQRLISILIWVGSGPTEVKVRGQRNGEVLEQRVTPHYYYMGLMTPAGPQFGPSTFPLTNYWVRTGERSIALPFFHDDTGPDKRPYLNEILGVRDGSRWVAFVITEMRQAYVDLRMDVFDNKKLLRSEIIHRAIRTNICRSDTIQSYSVRPQDGNGVIYFNTLDGALEYDVEANVLKSSSWADAGNSKCR